MGDTRPVTIVLKYTFEDEEGRSLQESGTLRDEEFSFASSLSELETDLKQITSLHQPPFRSDKHKKVNEPFMAMLSDIDTIKEGIIKNNLDTFTFHIRTIISFSDKKTYRGISARQGRQGREHRGASDTSDSGPSVVGKKTVNALWKTTTLRAKIRGTARNKSSPAVMSKEIVKSNLIYELQHCGFSDQRTRQLTFDDALQQLDKQQQQAIREREEGPLYARGPDLTAGEHKALHGLQLLFTRTNYQGNIAQIILDGTNQFNFRGAVPRLQINPAEYYYAYGVTRVEKSRGIDDFSGQGTREALDNLRSISKKRWLFLYTSPEDKKTIRRSYSPLISLEEDYGGITKEEREELKQQDGAVLPKLHNLIITLSPALVDNINKGFVLKPAGYIGEIEIAMGGARLSRFLINLANFFMTKAALNNMDITIEETNLAEALKMHAELAAKRMKRIRDYINKNAGVLQKLGYLVEYSIREEDYGKTYYTFILNPAKYHKAKEKKSDALEISEPL